MSTDRYKVTTQYMKKELFRALMLQGYVIRRDRVDLPTLDTKEDIREAHLIQRRSRLKVEQLFYKSRGTDLIDDFFANGHDVNPSSFDPEIIPVESGKWTGELFRVATLLWSIPVSRGYGRRMRFLVMDKFNGKLVGIIALGDPVFNLKVRDQHIGWNSNQRKERLFNVMDAYVLGAVPPYNELLAGKFIAGVLLTNEIRDQFRKKYQNTSTIIQGIVKPADLVLITTTSALGRSSIYNRVFYDNNSIRRFLMEKIGYTSGYGHFHIPEEIFELMRKFLEERDDNYANGHQFGNGPNWRMRVIRKTMQYLGYSKTPVLHHGIKREVFVAPLARNFREYLKGETGCPDFLPLTLEEYGTYFVERFMVPRYDRIGGISHHYVSNVKAHIEQLLTEDINRPLQSDSLNFSPSQLM
ncbi:Druantia anti-phage system protein DruA [Ferroacidibacillus organovorans]|uniref:Uncharacterized protein n=1 Tax=Ferroacidibacillus organovorans TaxID=1765683 RepID=A0A101XRE1_9BACL|nr:Druantia anti-phage system protein DruA [Ferroacidibacillus organovorans]KUO96130.1 hypothetical protein ATW55_14450 [Ferroacidibacillus organovorans]